MADVAPTELGILARRLGYKHAAPMELAFQTVFCSSK